MPAASEPAPGIDMALATRNAVAVPLGKTAILVTMRRGPQGPWSVVVDEPDARPEPLGPPPGYLALVGIGSCTIVTVAGVASRGESELVGMRVAFDVLVGDDGQPSIQQLTTLEADLSERDRLRLTRAVGHCPVGRDFKLRGVDIEDRVVLRGADREPDDAPGTGGADLASTFLAPAFVPGHVDVEFLATTREWREVDGHRILEQEGEVTAHVESVERSGERRHWGYLGGHSSAGWAPRPSAYALASLAASTIMTIRRLAGPLAIDPATVSVEVEVVSDVPGGGKEASQEAAARGTVARVRWQRTASAIGIGPDASSAAIERAMRLDPIYGYCERGDLLAADEVTVVPPAPSIA